MLLQNSKFWHTQTNICAESNHWLWKFNKFQAELDIQVRTCGKWYQPVASGGAWLLQAWPWSKDDPVNFDLSPVPRTMALPELDGVELDRVEEKVFKTWAPLDTETQVPSQKTYEVMVRISGSLLHNTVQKANLVWHVDSREFTFYKTKLL